MGNFGKVIHGLPGTRIGGVFKPTDRVVVISTANGLTFTDFLYKYHMNQLRGIESEYPFSAVELPADYNQVKDTILKSIESSK